jgi:hypothetical protein
MIVSRGSALRTFDQSGIKWDVLGRHLEEKFDRVVAEFAVTMSVAQPAAWSLFRANPSE